MIRFTLAIALLPVPALAAAAPGDEIYAHAARLLDAGDGAKLNVTCMGIGSPTVVLDGGWSDWGPAWAVVQPHIAEFARACAYDRAGSGFSGPGPLPRTTERIATELHTALKNGGIPGPTFSSATPSVVTTSVHSLTCSLRMWPDWCSSMPTRATWTPMRIARATTMGTSIMCRS